MNRKRLDSDLRGIDERAEMLKALREIHESFLKAKEKPAKQEETWNTE